jgi:siroheme synthase-like protein
MTPSPLFPIALKLEGRLVVVVGSGLVAETKAKGLLEAGARIRLVAPDAGFGCTHPRLALRRRGFRPRDLDGCWLAVSAATPRVNREVAEAAQARRTFVMAVDDPSSGTAHGVATLRRGGMTLGISTDGAAPALSGLVREALGALIPMEMDEWLQTASRLRRKWRREGVPMSERRPLLLRALNELYEGRTRLGGGRQG